MTARHSTGRCLAVWTLVTATVVTAGALLADSGVHALRAGVEESRFDTAVVGCCALAVVGCAVWAWLVTTAVVVELLSDRRDGDAGDVRARPGTVRRLVLVACGVALSSAVVAPALAAPGPRWDPGRDPVPATLVGLPLPDRAVDRPVVATPERAPVPTVTTTTAEAPVGSAAPVAASRGEVIVRPGDTLWQIAADRLARTGAAVEASTVERAWRALYSVNHDRIGPDPDLIQPGTRLRLPDPPPTPMEETS